MIRCPVGEVPKLPDRPVRADPKMCEDTFGKGSTCYGPTSALQLGRLLGVLSGVYIDAKSCEPRGHAESQPSPVVAPGAAVPVLLDGAGSAGRPHP